MITIKFNIDSFDYFIEENIFSRFDGKQNIEKTSPNYYIYSKVGIDSRGLTEIQLKNKQIDFCGDII